MRLNPSFRGRVDSLETSQSKGQPGIEFIKTVQVIPDNFPPNMNLAQVDIDVPECPFGKYRMVKFRFSAFGSQASGGPENPLRVRKNGGRFDVSRFYRSSSNLSSIAFWFSAGETAAPTDAIYFFPWSQSNGGGVSWMDIEFTKEGYRGKAGLMTNAAQANGGVYDTNVTFKPQNWADGTPTAYGDDDYPGLSVVNLWGPHSGAVFASAGVTCDIYGYPIR
jgi:hypothetical protein